jgi:hypothetical protein
MAGQSVGLTKNIFPVAELIRHLLDEADIELTAIKHKLDKIY